MWTREELEAGKGLAKSGRFSVVNRVTLAEIGRTDDVTLAMAYKVRGELRALYFDVIDNNDQE